MKILHKTILISLYFVPLVIFADPLTYKVKGENVTVVDCDESASGDLVISAKHQGKPVTSIGKHAFRDCSSLLRVTFPESVTSIGTRAFEYCSSLSSVTIPDSIKSVGTDAFFGCSSLKSIEVGKGNTRYASINGVFFDKK